METRDRILVESFKLFRKRGFKAVSMDDIAQELGVSKKTIYKWFANKDEVVQAGMEYHIEKLQQACCCAVEEANNAIEASLGMVAFIKEAVAETHPSVFWELQKYHPKSWQLWKSYKSTFILDKIREHIRRGVKEKLFREEVDVEILARLRLAQIDWGLQEEMYPPAQFDRQKVQLDLLEHFLLGMATLKGHKLINQYRQITEEEA